MYIYICLKKKKKIQYMFQPTNSRAEPAQYLELRHIVHVNLVLLERFRGAPLYPTDQRFFRSTMVPSGRLTVYYGQSPF